MTFNGPSSFRDPPNAANIIHAPRVNLKGVVERLLPILLITVIFVPRNLMADDTELMLQKAIEEYTRAVEESDRDQKLAIFSRSEQMFQQVIEQRSQQGASISAELQVNLANAALQAQHLGIAILNYRRALEKVPNHTRAQQNLAFARGLLPDWAQTTTATQLTDTLFFWKGFLATNSIRSFAAITFLMAALLFALGLVLAKPWLRNLGSIPFLVWLALASSLYFDPPADEGVITASEANLYSADSTSSPQRLTQPLVEGVEFQILQERGDWLEVQLLGRTGWLQKSLTQRVVFPS